MKSETKEKIRFWMQQFDEPDDEHDFIVNLVMAVICNAMFAAVVGWAVYTTYLI